MPHLQFHIDQLNQLPQNSDEVWQGMVCPPLPGHNDRHTGLWLSLATGNGHASDPVDHDWGHDLILLDALVTFATDGVRAGYRPAIVQLASPAMADQLTPRLREADIGVELISPMQLIDNIRQVAQFASLAEFLEDIIDDVLGGEEPDPPKKQD